MIIDFKIVERFFCEIYFCFFEIVVCEVKLWVVMFLYNLVNGVYVDMNEYFFKDIFCGEW